jgi:hypothetical protein
VKNFRKKPDILKNISALLNVALEGFFYCFGPVGFRAFPFQNQVAGGITPPAPRSP